MPQSCELVDMMKGYKFSEPRLVSVSAPKSFILSPSLDVPKCCDPSVSPLLKIG